MRKALYTIALLPSFVVFLVMCFFLIMSTRVPFGFALFGFILLSWLLSVGLMLQDKIPPEFKGNGKFYKINILYGLIFLCIRDFFNIDQTSLLIPFQLYGIFSFFYCLYFVSRSLIVAEEQNKVRFDRYIGTFFFFWFAPIGVWFLSSRIKKQILKK